MPQAASTNSNCPFKGGELAKTGEVLDPTDCDLRGDDPVDRGGLDSMDHVKDKGKDQCKSTCESYGWRDELLANACEDGWVVASDKKSCVQATGEGTNTTTQDNCNKITGAQWRDGECKCTTAGWVMNTSGTQCVKGDALIKAEGQAASRTRITSLYKKLNSMSNDFKVSVWRDKQGNFNTSRLASDSIAAVVLGTTGALVTSSVVKKNQVSNGFESITCQVGRQDVAGWGDEFSVGMQ